MDDCITRKAAHEMVRNLTRYVNVEIREMHGVNEMVDYDDVQSGLDKIPAADAWVNVKDRLPEQGARYLVIWHSIHNKHAHFMDILWHDAHDLWWNRMFKRNELIVTHWMPLPKPPEVKTDGT